MVTWEQQHQSAWVVCISNVSASQAFSHKAALRDGGLERCTVIKVKAPADGSAGSSSCGSDSLWGHRSAGGSVGTWTRRCATSSHPRTPQVGVCQRTLGRSAEENNLWFFECQMFWRCWRRMNLWDLTVYFSLMPRFQIWMLTSSLSEAVGNADTEKNRCFFHFQTSKMLWNH